MKKPRGSDGFNPYYPCEPIYRLSSLARALGISETRLQRVAAIANRSYRLAAEEVKKDGSLRQTYDAHPPLKFIQTRIKERILKRVEYPTYLNGSLKERSTRKNAAPHIGAKIAIGEDVANFFPSISPTLVKAMWSGLFGFSDDVATILTHLTTKDDGVPQGAVTSSYLANLAFWVSEPSLVRELRRRGLEYTRFVDDITVSSKRRLTVSEQSEVVGKIYGMLHSAGVKPKRSKHEVQTAKGRITTTKLVNNTRVSLSAEVRQNIRAAVYQLEARVAFGEHNAALWKQIMSVSSRVGRLNSFHPTEGKQLTTRIKALRKNFEAHKESTSASLSNGISLSVDASSTTKPADPPWL